MRDEQAMESSTHESAVHGSPSQQDLRPPSRPSLLPAFEPLSSSPSLPRPPKRKFEGSPTQPRENSRHYPTPVPTSSTNALPSSPPPVPPTRPGLHRTASMLSERTPLGTVPSIDLPITGEPVLMGRSSNASHYQLSANRLISRVHVRAAYRAPCTEKPDGEIHLECLGWNPILVHCRSRLLTLKRGDSFSSDKPHLEIMLDVQDTRVLLRWPAGIHRKDSASNLSDTTVVDDTGAGQVTPTPTRFASSPPLLQQQLQSPVSPIPLYNRSINDPARTFIGLPPISSPTRPEVQIYEDDALAEDLGALDGSAATPPDQNSTLALSKASLSSSSLSEPENFSDQEEENDPIIHSFGPWGENLLPRMASIDAASPERSRRPLKQALSSKQGNTASFKSKADWSPMRNHVINQLAFSRLHSLPLSTIMNQLPESMKKLTKTSQETDSLEQKSELLSCTDLKILLHETPCVGEIKREGKDAAGKPLEDEFYYVPELDTDKARQSTVENGLGKPGLRSVRKQHKQYYWKRPRH